MAIKSIFRTCSDINFDTECCDKVSLLNNNNGVYFSYCNENSIYHVMIIDEYKSIKFKIIIPDEYNFRNIRFIGIEFDTSIMYEKVDIDISLINRFLQAQYRIMVRESQNTFIKNELKLVLDFFNKFLNI